MRKIRKMQKDEIKLDEVDRAVIEGLQEDGRLSDVTLARRIGVSNDTVKRRRERLEKSGLIKIKALISPKKFGYLHYLHMSVTTKPSASSRAFAKEVSKDENVYYTALSFGHPQNVLVHYRGKTEEDLYDFVERVRRSPLVESVEDHVIFEVLKVSYHTVKLAKS